MGDEKNSKKAVIGLLIWKFLERGGVQIVQFIVSIVIARILNPEYYGIISIITVFTTLATVFVQSGLCTAIIREKNICSVQLSSIFYYSLSISTILYFILFVCAPWISEFYQIPQLTSSLRVMSLILFPGAFNSVQNALIARKMAFRQQCIGSLIAAALSGTLGIILAVLNTGVWALVFQQLSYQVFICFILFLYVKWVPKWEFSFRQTIGLFKYGIKLLGARLVDTIFHNVESLVIGKKFNSEMLALYTKGKQFPLIVIDNLDGSIQSVMFPVYAKNQDNKDKLLTSVRQTVSLSTYIVFPAMAGLAAVAYPLILLALGEQWIGSVPFLQIYCLSSALFPFQTANLQAFNAIGRSDVYFWIMTVKRVIAAIILCVAVFCFQSILAIAWATVLFEIVGILITMIANVRVLKYSVKNLISDTMPNIMTAVIMFMIINPLSRISLPMILILFIQIIIGVIIYVILSWITKNKNFYILLNNIKKRKNKRSKT